MLVLINGNLIDEVEGYPTSYWWSSISIGISQWVLEGSLTKPLWWTTAYMNGLKQEFAEKSYPVTMHKLLRLSDGQQGLVAGVFLMDYITATYGRDEIPRFLHSLNQYKGWDELIPAVFNVSVEEFEAGWNAWLAGRLQPYLTK
jgi:hypothetical protein